MRTKFTLILLLFGALLTMGAKQVQKPIKDFKDIAGTWKGAGRDPVGANTPKGGMSFPVILVIEPDGSFEINAGYWQGTGPMELRDGKIYYTSPVQGMVRVTLYERKGKRKLKAVNEADGTTYQVKPAKRR